jgi:AraC family L-rhamnose operon transcriptional activator RhaR
MSEASLPITRMMWLTREDGRALYVNRPYHDVNVAFHDHDFVEIGVVVAGRSVHRGIHGERAIGRGDCLVLHPGQWHGYARGVDLVLWNLCLPLGLFAHELAWIAADPRAGRLVPPLRTPAAPSQEVRHLALPDPDLIAIEAAFARIQEIGLSTSAVLGRVETIALAAVILARIGANLPRRHVPVGEDAAVAGLAAQMEIDLARPWKLSDLARSAGLTREHLCRRFRAIHGTPPLAWLNRRRAERAAVLLLASDASVAAIGHEVGWDDPNYCARRFRAAFGVNPAAYRRRVPDVIRG